MCPLSQCKSGETVYIKGFTGGSALRGKLHSMGLMPGEALEVISSNCGPLVVQTKGVKLAIGCGMAEKLWFLTSVLVSAVVPAAKTNQKQKQPPPRSRID